MSENTVKIHQVRNFPWWKVVRGNSPELDRLTANNPDDFVIHDQQKRVKILVTDNLKLIDSLQSQGVYQNRWLLLTYNG